MKRNNPLKSCLALLATAFAGAAFASTATVSLGTVASHSPWDGQFDVPYVLSGIDAAVDYKLAFEVTAAGQTAAVTNAATQLADGTYTNTLDTAALFGKVTTDTAARVRVLLIALKPESTSVPDATGTAVGAVGDVMVIDLSSGAEATSYPVVNYTSVDLGTFNCDVYKTTKLVLRKVAAGSPHYVKLGETNALESTDRLTPAKDYYIGVFPVTEAQYARVMGTGSESALTPKASVSWSTLRGGVETASAITSASEDGFFQRLCARTKLAGFDLPTEVQWEIAARADTTTLYGSYRANRHESPTVGTAENVADFAVTGTVAAVGTKHPNAWGLFDTAGNVAELCRDDYAADSARTDVETPYASLGMSKVVRGGDYNSTAADARLTSRNTAYSSMGSARNGFRLSRTCP